MLLVLINFLFLGMLSETAAQNCSTEIFVNHRMGLTGNLTNFTGDHEAAGLTKECIEANIPVEKNSVRCFKWKVMTSKQVQLAERHVISSSSSNKSLVRIVPNEVTFRSPGFFDKKHYHNSMFCIYNISLENCNHIEVVHPFEKGHQLFNDSMDYLQVYLGDQAQSLFGDEVASFINNAPTGSLYAILWSDSKHFTSRGTFELTAKCRPVSPNATLDETKQKTKPFSHKNDMEQSI